MGWATICDMFKDKNAQRTLPNVFLPFKEQTEQRVVTDKTASILAKLYQRKVLTPVAAHIAKQIPEVAKLID